MTGIYVLENKTNGKLYVGQSTNLKKRLKSHRYRCRNKCAINNAINKHSWKAFKKHVFYIPESLLDYFETEMIKHLDSLVHHNGYNLETGGNKNKHRSEESKKRQSESRKGKYIGEKHPNFGKTGDKCPNWKGDNASPHAIRQRRRKERAIIIR